MQDVEENRKESVSELSQLLTMGIKGITAYWVMTPILRGVPEAFHAGVMGDIVDTSFPVVDWLDWPYIAAGVCFAALGWQLSKIVPRKVGLPKIVPHSWKVPIGKTYRGKWVLHDFGGVVPHSIVAGATKYGKTAFIKLALYVLCRQQKPENLQIVIVDLKGGASFAEWEVLPHVISPVRRTVEEATEVLKMARYEMFERLDQIHDAKVRFSKVPKFPHLYVVIDEGSLLKVSEEGMKYLQDIAAIGREPHVHIIYGTQRPSHDILPVTTRDNLEGRFVFHLNEAGSSSVVLGDGNHSAYEMQSRPGLMMYRSPDGIRKLQAAYVPDDVLYEWLKSHADFMDIDGEVKEDNADKVSNVGVNSDTSSDIDLMRFLE